MGRKLEEESKRVHIWMDRKDIERIHAIFDGKLLFSDAVRRIVKHYLDKLEARAAEKAKPVSVDLEKEIADLINAKP